MLRDSAHPALSNSIDHFGLGQLAEQRGQPALAREHLTEALKQDAGQAAPVNALFARMFWAERRWPEAIAAADLALASNPQNFLALIIRSRCCSALGRMPEACAANLRALQIAPHAEFHSQLLFEMNFLEDTTPESLFAAASHWNTLHAGPLKPRIRKHGNAPDPDRRLTLGYVSSDLHQHAIMKFFPPVLEGHDRSRFAVFVYATGRKSDRSTEQVQALSDRFVLYTTPTA